MASVSELVRVIASAEDLEENFVSVYARSARESGRISHYGRGKNAAKMTSQDAANLLIAVNAGEFAKDAPNIIDTFGSLSLAGSSFRESHKPHSLHNIFCDDVSFADAFKKLIDLCRPSADGGDALGEAMVDGLGFPQGDIDRNDLIAGIDRVIHMKITFMRPKPFVLISFRDKNNRETGAAMFGDRKSLNDVERTVATTITQKTLRLVGAAIAA